MSDCDDDNGDASRYCATCLGEKATTRRRLPAVAGRSRRSCYWTSSPTTTTPPANRE